MNISVAVVVFGPFLLHNTVFFVSSRVTQRMRQFFFVIISARELSVCFFECMPSAMHTSRWQRCQCSFTTKQVSSRSLCSQIVAVRPDDYEVHEMVNATKDRDVKYRSLVLGTTGVTMRIGFELLA